MEKLKEWLPYAALAFLVGIGLTRYCSEPRTEVRETVRRDTLTVVRVDTVVVEKPVPVRVAEKEPVYIQVPVPGDTVFLPGDTLAVPVPIQQYSFRDSLYSLDVSGFNVSLDRLEVYPRTIYKAIANTVERTVTDTKRWGIGIQVGYGYNFGSSSARPAPYVGIGVQYSLWRF